MAFCGATAQRATDVLDRGLVAVPASGGGNYCSWRIPAEEYYDVTYNIYRDGVRLNAVPLSVSNYTDADGSAGSRYQVEAVVRGTSQPLSAAVTPWPANYLEVPMTHDASLTSTYVPNDACAADVDGDGEVELLLKFDNSEDIAADYPTGGHNGEYAIIEVYKLDGTRLWWIEMGPNMTDFQNNETNIVAYDWDGDGKAEALLRAADGTVIHKADGTTVTIGDPSKNYRHPRSGSVEYFVYEGDEYLLYLNGETGEPYQIKEYPLKRLEDGETNLNTAWGDGYGHRSSKHFFGAPFLDGRHASIFIARGIYTRHKMVTYDVAPATHELVERWRWTCNTAGSPWYGQGYHNYSVADVDWDGRDEIVFGSMVIDDNGRGLSTTGLGHGDSHHVGDFDPYIHGSEVFACNEDRPNNNFRDATTSKIYYRTTGTNDDGRALMGNFLNDYPGAQGVTSRDDNLISSVTHTGLQNDNKGSVSITQNFRIYWDGDLCDESFDYISGKNTAGGIYKPREGRIATLEGSLTNNDTKGTPCLQADILGDWREEVIMRTRDNNIRIYTTDIETPWRNYSLWYDHQYRQAVVWQMCGYNQTPHVSYFLGELEGITQAPAPLTMTGREEIADGGTLGSDYNDKHVILCETGDATISVADGTSPYIFTDNAPTWVQGNDNNDNITYTIYTHTVTGGAFTGGMRLVKQGDGVLTLPNVTQTYTGPTDVWAGTLNFDGTMQGSRVWLNRFAELNSDGGNFSKGIQMDYASVLRPGGVNKAGELMTDSLILNFGSRVVFDCYSDGASDVVKAAVLTIEKKEWTEGPAYLAPVFEIVRHCADGETTLTPGKYLLMEVGEVVGELSDLTVEGLSGQKSSLSLEDGKIYLTVSALRDAADVTWNGSENGVWDFAETENFVTTGTSTADVFVTGDNVVFDDNAEVTDITIADEVHPATVVFNNDEKTYTISGQAIAGDGSVSMNGSGTVVLNNQNTYTGGTFINGGTVRPVSLGNTDGSEYGSLGGSSAKISISNGATLDIASSMTSTQPIAISGEGKINVASGATFTQNGAVSQSTTGSALHKTGTGALTLGSTVGTSRLVINGGTVYTSENTSSVMNLPSNVVFDGKNIALNDVNDWYSYSTNNANFEVTEGSTATLYLDGRCEYNGRLTGKGSLSVVARYVRNHLNGNWSAFEGTVNAMTSGSTVDFRWFNTYGLPKATLNISNGVTVNCESRDISLGNLTGSGSLLTSGTITVGALNQPLNFSGTFSPNSNTKPSIVKVGSGRWTLSKETSAFKSVRINGGMLYLQGTGTTPMLPNLTINVADSGMIGGRGYVQDAVFASGTTLRPGTDRSSYRYGALAATGSIIMNPGSHLVLFVSGAGVSENYHAWVETGDMFTMNGDITLEYHSGYTPAEGDEIVLWRVASISGTPSAINLPELSEGLVWDTSGLMAATGVVRVVSSTGIGGIVGSNESQCTIYTTGGLRVAAFTGTESDIRQKLGELGLAPGTYIIRRQAQGSTDAFKVVVK